MKIFLYEHITGGGLLGTPVAPAASSLLAEGSAMMSAVAADLSSVPGWRTTALLDHRIAPSGLDRRPGLQCARVHDPDEQVGLFHRLAGEADWTLVIAPETNRVLAQRCRMVVEAGGRLLGPPVAAVEQLSDKLATARMLRRAGISAPESRRLEDIDHTQVDHLLPAVLKPRYGAGSQHVRLVCRAEQLLGSGVPGMVVESYCGGVPVSVAAFCGGGQCELAPAAIQRLSDNGQFQYLGGRLPIHPLLQRRAHRLVRQALATLRGLLGYIGCDLVLGEDPEGSGDYLIEVNPRVTTSYVGLREICRQNLARAMVKVAEGEAVELSFSSEPIEFFPDGRIDRHPRAELP